MAAFAAMRGAETRSKTLLYLVCDPGLGVSPMRRREFIALVGSGVAGWPLAARAQAERMRRIGLLRGLAESDPVQAPHRGLSAALERKVTVPRDVWRRPPLWRCSADRDDIQNEYWCEAALKKMSCDQHWDDRPEAGTKRLHADAMTSATVQTPKPNEINGENRRAGFRRTASPGPLLTRHLHRHRLLRASSFAFSRCNLGSR